MPRRRAEKIGTLLFCPECGTLLSLPVEDNSTYVECEQCQYREPATSYENIEVTTVSTLESIPSPLRLKRTTRTRAHVGGEVDTRSNEECPKCGHRESTYKEKQMRSADEGATLIYSVSVLFLRVGKKEGSWGVTVLEPGVQAYLEAKRLIFRLILLFGWIGWV